MMVLKQFVLRFLELVCFCTGLFWAGGLFDLATVDAQVLSARRSELGVSAGAEPVVLSTLDGGTVSVGVGSPQRLSVLCFLGTECPLAKLYGPRLQEMASEFSEEQVKFFGVFSNVQDDVAEIARYRDDHSLSFPCIHDKDQTIATRFLATRTPEVVVIDALGEVVYRGRIDDQYQPGIARQEPLREDLRVAIRELVSGVTPAIPRTNPVGCLIGRNPSREGSANLTVTYHANVRGILQRHCVECHRPSQIGPFALEDYADVAAWGEMILEVIDQGRMPPWHAAPPHDRFHGARVMATEEVEAIRKWVAEGMAEGDQESPPGDNRIWTSGWNLPRDPDLILPMAREPMKIPATGTVDYQYFVVDPGLDEDRWVQAAQVIPGNSRVVHHAICFVRPPDGSQFRGVGWLGAYVPGQQPSVLPPGHARFLPAGSKLVFQMHYTPTGKREEDLTSIGIVFADSDEVHEEIVTMVALNQSFEIPAGVARHQVTGTFDRFPPGSKLFSMMPHMHYRGTAFTVELLQGEERTSLLEVPRYDFNWQHDYRLKQPIDLDEYDSLSFTAVFDNSDDNPWNPDASVPVTWGDQSWEEMAVAFFDVSWPRQLKQSGRRDSSRLSKKLDVVTETTERSAEAKQADYVRQFFESFDQNGDGWVFRNETPDAFARFGFRQFDVNGDGRIDREEVVRIARMKKL